MSLIRRQLEHFHRTTHADAFRQRVQQARLGWHRSDSSLLQHVGQELKGNVCASLALAVANPLSATLDKICGTQALRPAPRTLEAALTRYAKLPPAEVPSASGWARAATMLGLLLGFAGKSALLLLGLTLSPLSGLARTLSLPFVGDWGRGVPTSRRLDIERKAVLSEALMRPSPGPRLDGAAGRDTAAMAFAAANPTPLLPLQTAASLLRPYSARLPSTDALANALLPQQLQALDAQPHWRAQLGQLLQPAWLERALRDDLLGLDLQGCALPVRLADIRPSNRLMMLLPSEDGSVYPEADLLLIAQLPAGILPALREAAAEPPAGTAAAQPAARPAHAAPRATAARPRQPAAAVPRTEVATLLRPRTQLRADVLLQVRLHLSEPTRPSSTLPYVHVHEVKLEIG